MTLTWTDWIVPPTDKSPLSRSPYVNWWLARPPIDALDYTDASDRLEFPLVSAQARIVSQPQAQKKASKGRKPTKGTTTQQGVVGSETAPYLSEFPIGSVPIRKDAQNDNLWDGVASCEIKHLQGQPDPNDLPTLSSDSVIVGIVDRGVPLNHTRLLGATGTRILSSWQMDAGWCEKQQPYLPFGREVYKGEIDDALNNTYSEDDFNAELGLVDLTTLNRAQDAAYRQSHGAAVLDLAAGAAPEHAPDNIWVIVINLPSRGTIGLSGAFLDYFASLACDRINLLANAIWSKSHPGQTGGYPIVMNMSFGKNAGPQRGDDFFQNRLAAVRAGRPSGAPFIPVLPVGNDNLEQGHARHTLDASGHTPTVIHQGWHVQPEDQSSSFLEIWSSEIPKSHLGEDNLPFEFNVYPPNEFTPGVAQLTPKIDAFRVLNPGAVDPNPTGPLLGNDASGGMFLRQFEEPGAPSFARLQLTLCILPTLDHQRPGLVVPSGEWVIEIKNSLATKVTFTFMVQTDQSDSRSAQTARRSWLSDPSYIERDVTGHLIDSYPYPALGAANLDTGIVQRHGTMNSTAIGPGCIAVASHRELDGQPANYSSTGSRNELQERMPDISIATEDGATHLGVIAAGSRNGSCLPIGGTSMAAAGATRRLSEKIARDLATGATPDDIANFDAEHWLRLQAQRDDPFDVATLARSKLGWGRLYMPSPDRGRPARYHLTKRQWPEPTG